MTARVSNDFDEMLSGEASTGSSRHEEPTGSRLDRWWSRLSPRVQWYVRWGSPALVVVVAAFARLWGLGHPNSLIFDETFYVKDAWTLTNLGYEGSWPAGADASFNAGDTGIFLTTPSFVVHPPLGKWIIGLGMSVLGSDNPVGWRIATAITGILAVVLLMVVAKVLFKSMALATVAGFLFAIDGNAIVMSRVALLDNYVMFFALVGFLAILLDRQWSAVRLSAWIADREKRGRLPDWGPMMWWRPWLLVAGIAFGATTAVKWNGLYFLAGFAIYTLLVDALARRRAGLPFWFAGTLFKQAPATFLLTIPVALVVYLSTWAGWFASDSGYNRHWADDPGNAWAGPLAWVPHSLQSLWHFESSVYAYHVGENRPHSYQANPLTWLLLVRPTSMYYQSVAGGVDGCASNCGESITGIANPIIWWAAVAAAAYLVYRLVRFREWRVGLVLTGLAVGYLPWLMYLNRTVFQFYTIAFEPYLILALVAAMGIMLGRPDDPSWRRVSGIRIVAIFLAIAVIVSVYFWPLWTGTQADYWFIASHWWLPTWR